MTDNYHTETAQDQSFYKYVENEYERKLREYATLPDPRRPQEDHYLEYFYKSLYKSKAPDTSVLPHSDLFYIREALEHQFPDRVFTMKEVKSLVKEIYNKSY
jgi:hypothetical protein